MKNLPSEPDLIAELKLTFPGLHVRPVREFGKDWRDLAGVWTGGTGDTDGLMPNGLPIFSSLRYFGDSEDPFEGQYDGGVNMEFTEWIKARGWYMEKYDGETHLIFPIQYALES